MGVFRATPIELNGPANENPSWKKKKEKASSTQGSG
jgi:hypothetical protein